MNNNIITVEPSNLNCIDSILRLRSKRIDVIDKSVNEIIEYMLSVIYSSDYATGLSAIQIGIPLRLFIVNLSRTPGREIIAINPEIESITGSFKIRNEGCLSLPNYKGSVKRRDKISFKATNPKGEIFRYSAKGYEAFVLQHEFDHLDGILYWDRMNENEIPTQI